MALTIIEIVSYTHQDQERSDSAQMRIVTEKEESQRFRDVSLNRYETEAIIEVNKRTNPNSTTRMKVLNVTDTKYVDPYDDTIVETTKYYLVTIDE